MDTLSGVISTHVGFAGGHLTAPDYRQVCTKTTGHAEVVLVKYDHRKIKIPGILAFFFGLHNATIDRRSNGGQYRSLIGLTHNNEFDENLILSILQKTRDQGFKITTEFRVPIAFFPASGRHQQYCKTRNINPKPPSGLPVFGLDS